MARASRVPERDGNRRHQFPSGYRHLAYLQAAEGFQVKRDLPGLTGPATGKLYAEGRQWLAGSDLPGQPR